jgi:hypothetical protein
MSVLEGHDIPAFFFPVAAQPIEYGGLFAGSLFHCTRKPKSVQAMGLLLTSLV